MQGRRLLRLTLVVVGLLLLSSGMFIALHPHQASAAPTAVIRYVYANKGTDTGSCTDRNHPCKSIPYAISQAADGDTIRVGSGIYSGTVTITRSITLEGGWRVTSFLNSLFWSRWTCNPALVTLDGIGNGRVLEITGPITPTVDCFTITGGRADGLGGTPQGNDAGGGIYVREAAPIIVNNVITGNYGCLSCASAYGRGGGIYMLDVPESAVISHNQIIYNVADEGTWGIGGGLCLENSDAQIISNSIEHNRAGHSAGYGGGAAVKGGAPILQGNTLQGNIGGQAVQGLGGGLYVWSNESVKVENNLFNANLALNGVGDSSLVSQGGGLYYLGNPSVIAIIRDNTFRSNIAAPLGPMGEGGAIYLGGAAEGSIVENNHFEENYAGYNQSGNGGGLCVANGSATIRNNHFQSNSASWTGDGGVGGALYAENATLLIQSNIISANFGGGFVGAPATTSGMGGGIALTHTTATIEANEFVGNGGTNADSTSGAGGALYADGTTLHLIANLFQENYASNSTMATGGAIYAMRSQVWADRNLIFDNSAMGTLYGRGGGLRLALCSPFTLTNNIIAHNRASEKGSGIALLDSNGVIAHNTIAQNYEGVGIGLEIEGGQVAVTNTILVSHSVGINVNDGASLNAHVAMAETLWGAGNWANATDHSGSGQLSLSGINIWEDPSFVAPEQWNYHLNYDSPAVDVGASSNIDHDLDGDPRPIGTQADLGADEVSCIARVNGISYRKIQEAINAAPTGSTIRVAAGTCYESLSITRSLTLEGGWRHDFSSRYPHPAEHTTVDAVGRGRTVSIVSAGTVRLDGFTFTGGNATGLGGSGAYGYDVGGGIYGWMSHVTLAHDIIRDNLCSTSTIGWGGGAGFYGGTALITDTVVVSNVATISSNGYGGGLYFRQCPAQIISATVRGNIASTKGYGRGGGIAFHFTNDASILRSQLEENHAATTENGYGGGIYAYYLTLHMEDSEVRRNVASDETYGEGGGLYAAEHSNISGEGIQFIQNYAEKGGGLYVVDSTVQFEEGEVKDNYATEDAGFSFLRSGGKFKKYLFDNNQALGYSIGSAVESQDLQLIASEFTRHTSDRSSLHLLRCERVTLEDCAFLNNSGTHLLVEIAESHDITVTENRFISNRSIVALASDTSTNVRLVDNLFQENSQGVTLRQSGFITLTRNTAISHTTEGSGGCLYGVDSHDIWIDGLYCVDNQASFRGGGVGLSNITGTLHVVNTILARNHGDAHVDGIYLYNVNAHLLHNTLAEQEIGLLIEAGQAWMTNSIIVGHTIVGVQAESGATLTLASTLWGADTWANAVDWTGGGLIVPDTGYWEAPQFLGNRYHLGPHSAAIDRGLPTDVTTDIDGDPRPRGNAPDLGADEANVPVFLPLVLRDYP